MGKRWSNPITVQGIESDDGRLFNEFIFRDLPLAFRWDKEDDGAHRGAMAVGVMDAVTYDEATGIWMGEGEYGDSAEAKDAQAIAEMGAAFLSADPGGKLEYHFDMIDPEGAVVDPVDIEKAYEQAWEGSADEAAKAIEYLNSLRERTTFDLYEVGGITQVDIPCWPQCRIALMEPAEMEPAQAKVNTTPVATLRAHTLLRRIASGPAKMPTAWFAQQDLTGPTKFDISDEGQMSGHLAAWDSCHRGYHNECVRPAYQTSFEDFHTGTVALDNDTRMRVGVITHHEGHLETAEDYRRLVEDPMAQLGPVRLYADEWGIQACGGVWPDLDPVEIARSLGAYPSGDWQLHGSEWRLHGCAMVNNPGHAHYEEEEGTLVRLVASSSLFTARGLPEAPSTHDHAQGQECACGGSCGACGPAPLSPARVLDLALLDKAVRTMGPRVPVR